MNRAGSSQGALDAMLLKRFAKLAIIAAFCVAGAGIAVLSERQSQSVRFESTRLFPGLEAQLGNVQQIVLTAGRGLRGPEEIVLSRRAEGGFGVDARGGYPANPRLVEKFLSGMARLSAYEKRAADEKFHASLGLVAPEKEGSALRIALRDGKGKVLAALLAGKIPEQVVDVDGQGLIYARRDGEVQAYLARGSFPLARNAIDYLDPVFLSLKPEDIARVTLWAGTDHPVRLIRDKGASDFALQDMPAGRAARQAQVNAVAHALGMAGFDDVAPETAFSFPSGGPRVELATYDGVALSLALAADAGFLWARVEAQGEGARADAVNKRVAGWIYRLPSALGAQLVQSMDLLTEPVAGPR